MVTSNLETKLKTLVQEDLIATAYCRSDRVEQYESHCQQYFSLS